MSEQKSSNRTNIIIAVICLAVIVVVGAVLAFGGKNDNATTKTDIASLTLSPASQNIQTDSDVAVTIWANSGTKSINAIQANLNYPKDKFDFVSIDSSNSAFTLEAQTTNSDGKVAIARGSTTPLRGNLMVAVVKLHSKEAKGEAKLSFDADTALVDSRTNKNVLQKTGTAEYTIK